MCDRRNLRDTVRQIFVSFGAVQAILTHILGMSNVSAGWFPKMLTKGRAGLIFLSILSLYEDDLEDFVP